MKTTILVSLHRAAPALAAACALLSGAVAQAQPTLASISPDGSVQFQWTNKLSFTLTSSSGITPANISVALSMTNLSNVGSTTNLYSTNGLTVGGTATSRIVTTPLTSNLTYTAIITATDAAGTSEITNVFDTVIPAYTWEAEDYDYGGGKYIDDPQTNAYSGLQATINVDGYNPNNGGATYRPVVGSGTDGDLGNESCGDRPRAQYVSGSLTDYDVGWNNGGSGEWGNYTRHYPAGKWNIYARVATWAAATGSAPTATMLQGGGASGTYLGEFVSPQTYNSAVDSNQYQNYTFVPLTDVAGNLVEWDTDGSAQILTTMVGAGSYNFNFFMLMPINPDYKPVPYVTGVSPNGATEMFPTTNLFTFTANSVPGMATNDVVVTLNGIRPYGLTYSGSSHALKGSFPMAPNVIYSVAITLTDANGSSSYTTSFGTYSASNYTFECEDFDHDSGQFFDNPQVNAYTGLAGVNGVDANNSQGGGTSYRSNDTGDLGNEINGDAKRAQYTAAGTNDYDIGWTAAGNWANYTRTYPTGVYNVIFRAAGNAGGAGVASLLRVTSGVGTSSQTTSPLGQFNVPNTGGWQNYTWAPLVDANGNLVTITNSGKVSTLQLYEDAGGWNGNFLMFSPPDTTRPVISQIYPNGKTMFQPTNTLSFVVTSALDIDTNLLSVTINGVALNNLVFSGPPTNLTVSWPHLQPLTPYSAVIFINTTNNDPAVVSYYFDTFGSANYTFEAEDWDNSSGKFVDNPQVDSYLGFMGTAGVDALNLDTGSNNAYRPEDAGDPGTEITGDVLRAQYLPGTNDYDVGWTAAGQWLDYTRTYPTGVYNLWLRAAGNPGGTNAASLSQVTSGLGTSNQTTTALGQFNIPNTGAWQTYTFTPLVDSNGNLVTITNSGKVLTLRLNQVTGGYNLNFLMLVPAAPPAPGPTVTISWTPAGGTLLSSPTLGSSAVWTPVANAANPMTLPIGKSSLYFRVQSTTAAKVTIKSP